MTLLVNPTSLSGQEFRYELVEDWFSQYSICLESAWDQLLIELPFFSAFDARHAVHTGPDIRSLQHIMGALRRSEAHGTRVLVAVLDFEYRTKAKHVRAVHRLIANEPV